MQVWILQLIYLLNAAWFTAALIQFSVAQNSTLKILVPREARGDALAPTIKAAVAFLGGLNGALAVFCILLAAQPHLFAQPAERTAILLFLALANFSQFFFNLPVLARGGRKGVAYWPVLSGPMLRIFVIDGLLTLIDGVAAIFV